MKNTALKNSIVLLLLTIMITFGCKKDRNIVPPKPIDSFLPMQVGNLWYTNKENYTTIQDSTLIDGKLFYKFYSLIGGDAISISYLRIDEQGKLIASDPKYPDLRVVRADFNAKVGDVFFTTGSGTDTDQQVTVTEKTSSQMSFSFENIYHPNLKGHPYLNTYIRGQGFPGNWAKLRINGVQIK
ncbi:MAG: hypothetical protein EOO86_14090 [Pedobacter sp.]|nr:MAG: hypothetical protein EOO86_14090 [Pedobacter sp.]